MLVNPWGLQRRHRLRLKGAPLRECSRMNPTSKHPAGRPGCRPRHEDRTARLRRGRCRV